MKPPSDQNLLSAQNELTIALDALRWASHDLAHFIDKRANGYKNTLAQRLGRATSALANVVRLTTPVPPLERGPNPGDGWIPAKELASG